MNVDTIFFWGFVAGLVLVVALARLEDYLWNKKMRDSYRDYVADRPHPRG